MMPQRVEIVRPYIIKGGNAGLVTTTAGNDLLHTLPLATFPGVSGARSAVVRQITAYNNTGANVTLRFGTLDRLVPTFVQTLPTLVAINTLDNAWNEDEDFPFFEFLSYPQLTAAGRTGDIYVVASAAGVLVAITVYEFGG